MSQFCRSQYQAGLSQEIHLFHMTLAKATWWYSLEDGLSGESNMDLLSSLAPWLGGLEGWTQLELLTRACPCDLGVVSFLI